MHHDEIISTIQNFTNRKPILKDFANILGVSVSGIGNRAQRNSQYSVEEIRKLEQYYKCDILNFDKNKYINSLASGYAENELQKKTITPELKADLQKIYDEGIDLNWFILGKGNKYRASEFEQVKDELAQRMEKMENALRNAGILTD